MTRIFRRHIPAFFMMTAFPAVAQAQSVTTLPDTGDSAWLLMASALVLFMTLPGLALFYGGLVRARNFLSVLMQSFAIACGASLLWMIAGYSLVFSGGASGWIGDFQNMLLNGLAPVREGLTIPENLFALYQMTFAIITPVLIIGAFPERVRFGWVIGFALIWLMLVYVPVAHWIWGGGWMAQMGVLDFAGGIVVHTTAGIAALVTALMIGRRRGFPQTLIAPHSPALTMTGAGMLWVGWFGFNGGSALASGAGAASAIIATHLAASAAALVWVAAERIKIGKPTSIGIVTGAVAGLATITPAAGYVGPAGAILIGAAGGLVCFGAVLLFKHVWHVDDSLDVFAVHGVGGMLGSLLLAVFAAPALGGVGFAEGMTMGSQLGVQALAVAVAALWSGLASWGIARLVSLVWPMRVDEEAEYDGLDITSHGERAYEFE